MSAKKRSVGIDAQMQIIAIQNDKYQGNYATDGRESIKY